MSKNWLISLPAPERERFLNRLSEGEKAALYYRWPFWARDEQLAPAGDWRTWLVLAGRGFGKTRTGAEWVRDQVESGRARRVALVAPTAADCRDVMVEGESGLLAICPPWFRPKYEPSKRRLTWPNGAIATTYSADEPKRLRGPQHDAAWADELCAWRFGQEAWDMLMFGLRLGKDPRIVVTTTPRVEPVLKKLLKSQTTTVTKGSTYDNAANLAAAFMVQIIAAYEGTRLGRQELNAELLEDNPDALWKREAMIEAYRVTQMPALKRIVVAVDPSASGHGDECGIVVAGIGVDGQGYVIDDRSLQGSPNEWAKAAVAAYHVYQANHLVAETNQGGEMVETVLRTVDKDRVVAYKAVHASRGKYTRAEPIAALYEQGKVHHIGSFAHLEDQLCQWTPGEDSPDRLDALVWALSELMLKPVRKLTAA